MLQLTRKEIDLIQEAIERYGNTENERVWAAWLLANPLAVNDRSSGPLTTAVAQVILTVLRSSVRAVTADIKSGKLDEDTAADLGNDLTVTEAVVSDLSFELGYGAHPNF